MFKCGHQYLFKAFGQEFFSNLTQNYSVYIPKKEPLLLAVMLTSCGRRRVRQI